MSLHDEAHNRRRLSLNNAIDETSQYWGFHGVVEIEHDGEIFEIRHRTFWTPEQIKAMAELDAWLQTLDHNEVLVRNPINNEIIINPDTGKPLTDRVLVVPHRKNGKLVFPTFESRYLAALWGDDKARRFEAAGGTYGVVMMQIAQMDDEFTQWRRNREQRDSKSQ